MDVGRLDDISKNMGVQVKHGHPQIPILQNMDDLGLNTCKTWTSKHMKIWTPMLFETKVWTIERSNVCSNVSSTNSIFVPPESDVVCHFHINLSRRVYVSDAFMFTALPVEFSSKWICRTLILMIYNGHLRHHRCYKIMMKGKTD